VAGGVVAGTFFNLVLGLVGIGWVAFGVAVVVR
jgi:hypothetical protein